MHEPLRIAIVGGGIGGLAVALALRARGQEVTVYEKAAEFTEIGAGLGVAPNALRLLDGVGLGDQIRKIGSPRSIATVRTWQGDVLPVVNWPYASAHSGVDYTVHRAELQSVLVNALPFEVLRLGHRAVAAEEAADGVRVSFANGARAEADVVVGADGIHSTMHAAVGVQSRPTSEHVMAYRGLIPTERLTWVDDAKHGAMWVGPRRSFLCFPVSAGRLMNVVAFVPTDHDAEESWSAPGEVSALAAEYAGWDAPVGETIDALESTFRWGIYDRAPLPRWSTPRMTLLGDAAHAMVPHLGQGANQSIEDGFALAVLLQDVAREEIPRRLQIYEEVRRARTSRVQSQARLAGRIYRAGADDTAETARQIDELSDGYWLADYDAEQEATSALQRAG
jgi:salicylate hydroxylase